MTNQTLTVTEAATSGDYKALLIALRDRLAPVVDDPKTSARDLAPLTRRITELTEEIDKIEAAEGPNLRVVGDDEAFDPGMV